MEQGAKGQRDCRGLPFCPAGSTLWFRAVGSCVRPPADPGASISARRGEAGFEFAAGQERAVPNPHDNAVQDRRLPSGAHGLAAARQFRHRHFARVGRGGRVRVHRVGGSADRRHRAGDSHVRRVRDQSGARPPAVAGGARRSESRAGRGTPRARHGAARLLLALHAGRTRRDGAGAGHRLPSGRGRVVAGRDAGVGNRTPLVAGHHCRRLDGQRTASAGAAQPPLPRGRNRPDLGTPFAPSPDSAATFVAELGFVER